MKLDYHHHQVSDPKEFRLKDHGTEPDDRMKDHEAQQVIDHNIFIMSDLQEKLFASGSHALLIIFQAMDAAGKDGTLRRLLTGINPQGCMISNFKKPTPEEVSHDFLWRLSKRLPPKGMIGVFNRSHYEEVLVCKVHPEFVTYQNIPGIRKPEDIDNDFWEARYEAIREWEQHLHRSGTRILKFFLNVSKAEQRERLTERMDDPSKHWKFNLGDIQERAHWEEYMDAYEEAIRETSRDYAPWFVIPADDKDYMRAAVTSIVRKEMEALHLSFPDSGSHIAEDLKEARRLFDLEDQ